MVVLWGHREIKSESHRVCIGERGANMRSSESMLAREASWPKNDAAFLDTTSGSGWGLGCLAVVAPQAAGA